MWYGDESVINENARFLQAESGFGHGDTSPGMRRPNAAISTSFGALCIEKLGKLLRQSIAKPISAVHGIFSALKTGYAKITRKNGTHRKIVVISFENSTRQ